MGPSALRVTRLADRIRDLGFDVSDFGDVVVPLPEVCKEGDPRRKYLEAICSVCGRTCEAVELALSEERFPIVLGGDHSLAAGSIAGAAKHFRSRGEKVGVIWFDAHGDMNTPETSRSGNIHGMSLAHLLGKGDAGLCGLAGVTPAIEAKNVVLCGIRDLDPREKTMIAESGVRLFTMKDIDRIGATRVIEEAIRLAGLGTSGIYVSLDMDALDPEFAPGVGTPVRGGLTYREAHLCMEMLADTGLVRGIDIVEVNPSLDMRNATAELAVELLLSLLGKRII